MVYLPLLGLGHSQRCWLTVFCSFLLFSWPKSNPVLSFLSTLPSCPLWPHNPLSRVVFADLILWKYWRTKEMSVALALAIIWPSPMVYSVANSASAWRILFFKSFVLFLGLLHVLFHTSNWRWDSSSHDFHQTQIYFWQWRNLSTVWVKLFVRFIHACTILNISQKYLFLCWQVKRGKDQWIIVTWSSSSNAVCLQGFVSCCEFHLLGTHGTKLY